MAMVSVAKRQPLWTTSFTKMLLLFVDLTKEYVIVVLTKVHVL
jgi:hypothetical protein